MAPKKSTSPDKAPVPGSLAPKMEKVRNPTSRLGPKDPAGQPLESNRPAESSRKTKKESKTERKGDDKKGSKADKDADSPPAKAEKAKETGSADKAKKAKIETSKPDTSAMTLEQRLTQPTAASIAQKAAAAGGADPNMLKVVSSNDKVGEQRKKVDFLTEELMSRKPLDEKARETLIKKCGRRGYTALAS